MVARDRIDRPGDELRDLHTRIRRLEAGADIGFSSITRGRLRVASNEGLLVEGSSKVEGWLIVTGTERVTGLLEILGELVASGDITLSGTTDITGPVDITGAVHIDGTTSLTKTLTVSSPGKIVVAGVNDATLQDGALSFDTGGKLQAYTTGATLQNSTGVSAVRVGNGSTAMVFGGNQVRVETSGTVVQGDHLITGAKSFRIDHPTKPDMYLRHGCTESPVSGVEYWGEETLDDYGTALVALPDYFEALAKPDGRTVFVYARGFSPDWTDIDTGTFTVTGKPGGRISWLVKAERYGGDFDVEYERVDIED